MKGNFVSSLAIQYVCYLVVDCSCGRLIYLEKNIVLYHLLKINLFKGEGNKHKGKNIMANLKQ